MIKEKILIKINNPLEAKVTIDFIKSKFPESKYESGNLEEIKWIIFPYIKDKNKIDSFIYDSLPGFSYFKNYEILDIKLIMRSFKLKQL
jgi:hypothetical protein